MIRHVVLFGAKRVEDIPAIREALERLGTIPHVAHFEVAENRRRDQLANDTDVIVYAEFEHEEALAAYKAHPTYQATTERVRPLRETRIAVDFAAARRSPE